MSSMKRRDFVKILGGTAALGTVGFPYIARSATKAKVVVIGAGYGGSIAAKYTRLYDSGIEVTLIEKSEKFISCPLSNEALSGERTLQSLSFGFDGLAKHGINVVIDEVSDIDATKKKLKTASGKSLDYDMLVVSPGVSFKWGAIEGYDEAATQYMPHAWFAGEQTLLLRKQLEQMKDGGKVFIVAPPNPFKCPPGPYERAAQIAHYLKHNNKSKSTVTIMDWKDQFSKRPLFEQGWEMHYPGMIKWVPAAEDGKVLAVEAKKGVLVTDFEEHQADVANVIPPQKAGIIADKAGLTNDSGWCPVNQANFESTIHKDVFVIGDSCIAGKMPKSGYAANTQAKVVAGVIAARVSGKKAPKPAYTNTCYSLITPHHGISVAGVYQLKDGEIVGIKGAGGVSPLDASKEDREAEATYALSWFKNITKDMFS
jgi:sulfide dehydrogenase [flavocytochrome c] flavoprotein subunit